MALEFKREIEEFFDYSWSKDRNSAMRSEQDLAMLEQLPTGTVVRLYSDFLFDDFLKAYKRFFALEKDTLQQHSYYTFYDQEYTQLMLQMLMALEPIRVTGSKVIFEELDNISMIYFFLCGYFDIGYEINHK